MRAIRSAVEPALFGLLLSNRDISELTFTYGKQTGFDEDGELQLAATPRGQISVVRSLTTKSEDRFWSRHILGKNWRVRGGSA